MHKSIAITSAVLAVALAAPLTLAQDKSKDGAFAAEIKARKSLMQVYKFNIGILGAMAKGKRPYDAKLASSSGYNLHLASLMQNGAMWPKGSDHTNAEVTAKTTAKPDIWSTYPKVAEKGKAFKEATEALYKVAGNGLDDMKKTLGPVGKSCKSCHDDFRVKVKK